MELKSTEAEQNRVNQPSVEAFLQEKDPQILTNACKTLENVR